MDRASGTKKNFRPGLQLCPKCCSIWFPEKKAGQKCCCIGWQVFSCPGWEMDHSRVQSNTVPPWAAERPAGPAAVPPLRRGGFEPVTTPAGRGDSFVLCARPSRQPGSPACNSRAALSCFHLQRFQVRSDGQLSGVGVLAVGRAGAAAAQLLRLPGSCSCGTRGSQRQVSCNGTSSLLKELVLDSPELPADTGGLHHLLLVPSCQLILLPYLQRSARL